MNASTPRLPANYRVVLEAVNEYGMGRHATAQDVFETARRLRPGIGFTTVHRGLARLSELGYVLKLDISGEGSAMYEPATETHAHFRCTACGAVEDVDFTCDPATRARLETSHGLAIRSESITFTGLCRACATTAPAPGAPAAVAPPLSPRA